MSPIDHLRITLQLDGTITEAHQLPPHLHNVYNDLVLEVQRMLEHVICPVHKEGTTLCWLSLGAPALPVQLHLHLCCGARLQLFERTVPPPPTWIELRLSANPEQAVGG